MVATSVGHSMYICRCTHCHMPVLLSEKLQEGVKL